MLDVDVVLELKLFPVMVSVMILDLGQELGLSKHFMPDSQHLNLGQFQPELGFISYNYHVLTNN